MKKKVLNVYWDHRNEPLCSIYSQPSKLIRWLRRKLFFYKEIRIHCIGDEEKLPQKLAAPYLYLLLVRNSLKWLSVTTSVVDMKSLVGDNAFFHTITVTKEKTANANI